MRFKKKSVSFFFKLSKTLCIYSIQDMLLSENVCAFQDPIKEHYNDEKGKRYSTSWKVKRLVGNLECIKKLKL